MILVTDVYQQVRSFPQDELFGLTSQIRRSAVSIPANIAEGYGRHATGDYVRFLRIAVGSLFELQTELEISRNLQLIPKNNFTKLNRQTNEIERMLRSLINKLAA
jgi:four helix bundle protein